MQSPNIVAIALRFAAVLAGCALILWVLERRWRVLSKFTTEEAPATDLAIARIAIMATLLWFTRLADILPFTALDHALLVPPRGWSHIAGLLPLSRSGVLAAYAVLVAAGVLGAVGWFGRLNCGIAALAALYLHTIPQLFGKVNHTVNHLLLFSLILAVAPSCDALSLDARRVNRRGGVATRGSRHQYGRAYAVALQTMMLIIALAYFFPGAWKLARSGSQWFAADNLGLLIQNKLLETHVTALQHWVLASPLLLRVFAVATVMFELGFVFAILSPRTRMLAAIIGFGFHESTALLMDIHFPALQATYIVFVPSARCRAWLARAWQANGATGLPFGIGGARGPTVASPLGLRVTATLILCAVTITGALHVVRTWPIACYPTFDLPAVPEVDRLVLVVHDSANRERAWTLSFDSAMGARLGTDRWRGLVSSFTDPKRPFTSNRGVALAIAWNEAHPTSSPQSATLMVETYRLTDPTHSVLRRRIVGNVVYPLARAFTARRPAVVAAQPWAPRERRE